MINKLPRLSDPAKYVGLYIFDFGDHVSLGYTAEEIEFLLADPRYARGMVYKIHRTQPDGTLEIRGANPLMWNLITGLVFWFEDRQGAYEGYERLKESASRENPPGEFELILVENRTLSDDFPFAVIMCYVQELDDALATWLLRIKYNLGRQVESGRHRIEPIIKNGAELMRDKFGAVLFRRSRTRQEVLESVENSVQR